MFRPSVHGCFVCFCWAEKLPGFAGLLAFLPRLKLHRTRQLSPILRRAELGAAVFSFGHAMGTSLAGSHGNASNGGLSPDGCNWDSTWGGADRGTMRSWTLTSDWSFPLVFKNGDLTCNLAFNPLKEHKRTTTCFTCTQQQGYPPLSFSRWCLRVVSGSSWCINLTNQY